MADRNTRNVRETSEARDWDEPRRNNACAGGFFRARILWGGRGFSPLYAAETEQSSAEAGTSERNMEFIRRTMLSAKVQDVVAKVNLAGQNLLVATNRRDPQNLQSHSRALRTALAWDKAIWIT
jgi:hypothetical protein